jgi:hypothetical protein
MKVNTQFNILAFLAQAKLPWNQLDMKQEILHSQSGLGDEEFLPLWGIEPQLSIPQPVTY